MFLRKKLEKDITKWKWKKQTQNTKHCLKKKKKNNNKTIVQEHDKSENKSAKLGFKNFIFNKKKRFRKKETYLKCPAWTVKGRNRKFLPFVLVNGCCSLSISFFLSLSLCLSETAWKFSKEKKRKRTEKKKRKCARNKNKKRGRCMRIFFRSPPAPFKSPSLCFSLSFFLFSFLGVYCQIFRGKLTFCLTNELLLITADYEKKLYI